MSRENEVYTEEILSYLPRDEDGDILPDGAVDIRWTGYTESEDDERL